MTIWLKEKFEKELYDALQAWSEGVPCGVQVQSYCEDGCMATVDVNVSMFVNGEISDLPSGYHKDDPESERIVSIVKSRKKMDWKEFDKVCNELKEKGYYVNWKTYYKGKPLTNEIRWKVAPNKFTYEIVRVDRYD